MVCPKCHSNMSLVYHFSKEESREFYLCNSCYYESRHIPVAYDRINRNSGDEKKSKSVSAQLNNNIEKHKNKQKR
jgi:protein-arginine kinase activator protein McsA